MVFGYRRDETGEHGSWACAYLPLSRLLALVVLDSRGAITVRETVGTPIPRLGEPNQVRAFVRGGVVACRAFDSRGLIADLSIATGLPDSHFAGEAGIATGSGSVAFTSFISYR